MKLPKAYATSVRKRAIDMTLSVNPLGCSPRVTRALSDIARSDISAYPDTGPLIAALAEKFRLPQSSILLGTGSEQLIKLTSQAFLRPNDTVLVESGSFFLFSKEPVLVGATVRFFAFGTPVRLRRKPALLFIANPTTPGGENRTNKDVLAVIDRIKPEVAVIDEANGEFRDGTMISELKKRPNLIVLRTFSKALGLAGLRIGMAFGTPKNIRRMGEFLQPFPVTSVSLTAAMAALGDDRFLLRTKSFVARQREYLTRELETRGFRVSRSVTNNLFVSRPRNKAIIAELAKRGVSVIDGTFFPGNKQQGFRISLKDQRTNRRFLEILDEVLACLDNTNLLGSKEEI